jgi:hypothetical protein
MTRRKEMTLPAGKRTAGALEEFVAMAMAWSYSPGGSDPVDYWATELPPAKRRWLADAREFLRQIDRRPEKRRKNP